ncbi:hypothetical protein ACJRO7_031503 [Eucalyptus globulus]|uniref:Uncharacterized protein n=1 Tax=Eucalyptus globulus TaxID=34317 RepID=A0ABD3JL91_EUCGL
MLSLIYRPIAKKTHKQVYSRGLQMYQTVKTTDRAAANSSGQTNVFDNGSSGETSDDLVIEVANPKRPELGRHDHQDTSQHGLWSNSSRLLKRQNRD